MARGRRKPGIYDIAPEHYHADPCAVPSLSSSIASIICSRSPRHAWHAHPRLNPDFAKREDGKFDIGTVAHALLLENKPLQEVVEVVYADDWRTSAAKEVRDMARAAGRIALLAKDAEAVLAMIAATVTQLAELGLTPAPFSDGKPERTLIWKEGDVYCRALVDWLHDDLSVIDDFKTAHDARPDTWTKRALFDHGYDVQAAFYRRGIRALTGITPDWRWIVVEKTPPHALVVVEPGSDVLAVGEAKVDYALRRWSDAMRTGYWPAYAEIVIRAELPAWADDARFLVEEVA